MIGGLITGAMSLIALQVFAGSKGAERGGALLQWVSSGVEQLLSSDKAAIPNVSGGAKSTKPPPKTTPAPSTSSGGGTPVSLPKNPILTQL